VRSDKLQVAPSDNLLITTLNMQSIPLFWTQRVGTRDIASGLYSGYSRFKSHWNKEYLACSFSWFCSVFTNKRKAFTSATKNLCIFHANEYYAAVIQLQDTTTEKLDICWTVHHRVNWRIKNQLDATYYFIVLFIGSTCFGHYYAHHQEVATMMLITTLVVSFLICCRLEVRCG